MQPQSTQSDPSVGGVVQPALHDLCVGALTVRQARGPTDIAAVQALRGQRFHRDAPQVPDGDEFDPLCLHLMVERAGLLLATARVRLLSTGPDVDSSYTAQTYDMRPVAAKYGRVLEIGRLCLSEGAQPASEVLRALFAGMTALALHTQAQVLTGCASFHGADVARHAGALAYLRDHHLGPPDARPAPCAAVIVPFAHLPKGVDISARHVPPLLRMYLAMGGWVSDFAVIDSALDTLHVLVAVPVATIPPSRLRVLGALLAPVPLPLT